MSKMKLLNSPIKMLSKHGRKVMGHYLSLLKLMVLPQNLGVEVDNVVRVKRK